MNALNPAAGGDPTGRSVPGFAGVADDGTVHTTDTTWQSSTNGAAQQPMPGNNPGFPTQDHAGSAGGVTTAMVPNRT
jgi:hypothetical protein